MYIFLLDCLHLTLVSMLYFISFLTLKGKQMATLKLPFVTSLKYGRALLTSINFDGKILGLAFLWNVRRQNWGNQDDIVIDYAKTNHIL